MRLRLAHWSTLPLLAVPASTWAFGLGELEVQSDYNQPLRAQIELLSVTPEILESLRVDLAPLASFEQFAVDRPAFLTSFDFTFGRDAAGRSVALVTSSEPIRELFVTMFVEARWSGGSALREYTMLFDLPVQPGQTIARDAVQPAPASVSEPNVVDSENVQAATTSAPQSSTPASSGDAQTAATAQATTVSPSSGHVLTHGPVQRAETLWDIATAYRPAGVTMNQMMLAIYEANPQAFGSNMNVLRIGAVLQIPDLLEWQGLAANTATIEVQRQTAQWQDRSSQQAVLTAPSPSEAALAGVEVTPAQSTVEDSQIGALQTQIGDLQSELEEIRRTLALRDAELNEMRMQLAAGVEAEAATQPEVESVMPQPAAAAEFVDLESISALPDERPVEAPAEAAATTPPPAATVATPSTQDPATVPEARSMVSLALRLLAFVAAAIGVMALLWTALAFWRRRSDAAVADDTVIRQTIEERSGAGDTCRISAQFARVPDEDFVVHEEPVESTVEGQRDGLLLDEDDADSLAATGFHLGYESCDRAAAPVLAELAKDPDNRELKLRLTEVYFQWGNKAAFLDVARELSADLGQQTDNVWDKVVIMGRQICPDDDLFAEGTPSAGEIDVHLQEQTSSALDLAFDEQDQTDVDVDTDSAAEVEPDAIDDDAVTVLAEATEELIARSEASRDAEKTVDLPAAPAELDASTVAIVRDGEPPRAEASPTVTQEWHDIDASATLEEPADLSATTVVSKSPDATAPRDSVDDTVSQSPLGTNDMLEGGAVVGQEKGLALVDELVTTLDLAKAYVSIGQPELAVPMLEEALQAADGEQAQARQMLEDALGEAAAALEKIKRSA